ncbi:mitotic checkpoint [Olea europaea subsp. europaea]|uniref:Mitotic checkpoint n=1 Tax=Olea europaea subsp. europaea TaxID=158383 RepID=A0A8S0V187_OLEEU|nr:mitotic checkpoint [Olea europaea subsp. europaea]
MTAAPQSTGRELTSPPTEGISNIRFSNHSDNLLVSSWDKSVRLYDASANALRGEFMHGGAVLDCCFHDDSSGFTACADHTVRRLVFNHSREDILGRHDAPVRCIEYSYATGQVITGSWDKTLKCWDPRGASGQERSLIGTYTQPERIYSLSLVGNRLVVATAGRHVNVYDLRNMNQPEQRRESSLKYQTRCVRCYPNGTGAFSLSYYTLELGVVFALSCVAWMFWSKVLCALFLYYVGQ